MSTKNSRMQITMPPYSTILCQIELIAHSTPAIYELKTRVLSCWKVENAPKERKT